MSYNRWLRGAASGAVVATLLLASPATPVSELPAVPEPVAETRLLMNGLALPNFRGLERLLKQSPKDAEAWVFARGQALLLGETANLLLLRPPHNRGQAAWLERSVELRSAATRLAQAAAGRDYAQCRGGLATVANTCNRCHQTFRINVKIQPFGDEAGSDELPPPRRLLDNRTAPD